MNITFSDFFRSFKTFADDEFLKINYVYSDSDLVNFLFEPLIKKKNINNKNADLLYLDKSRVSLILTGKSNVPIVISNEYHFLKTNIEIKKTYISMFKECISSQNTRKLLDLLGVKGDDEYLLLFDCLVESLIVDNKKKKQDCTVLWENGCNSIHIVSGDIFDYCFKRSKGNNIIVIPVDTNFNIHVSTKLEMINPLVSAETLHGKWIRRCENAGYKENEIQNKIQTFLNTQYHNEYKIGEYPIGTIVPFGTKFGTTYLLSISIFDDSNIAHSNEESIKIAIKSLLEFYDCNGQGYPVYIPLMGTGRSRVNLSYQQSFELIKETLLQNRTHIQGIVNIVALPEVYKKLEKRGEIMPYRTKTYIAGDWEHDQNAINQLYKWKNSYYWSFDFIDAHEFKQARDSSLNCSIKRSLKERLNRSKTFVLVVGEHTKTVTAGSCHYCRSYNSYLKHCSRNSSLEYRSFIQYECEEAIKANMNIIILYNSNYIYKSWCPDILKNVGYHVSMMKNNVWNYTEIKHLFDILS